MQSDKLNRRDFSKLTMAALGGIVAGVSVGRVNLAAGAEGGSLLLGGKNVCRGLNHACAHHKGGKNKCAGMGSCATAKAHGCSGKNDCKGQGGCGEKPGENACKGKGDCSVPLSDDGWKKARANFEAAMQAAGKKFGPAPSK
jgi:hypothetical protein